MNNYFKVQRGFRALYGTKSFLHPRNATFGSFFAVPYPTFSKREILPTNRGFAWTLQGSVGPRPTVCMNLDPATESKCFEDWEPSGAPRTLGTDDLDHFQGEQRFRDLDSCRISNQWISMNICYHQRHRTCKLEENGKTAWKSPLFGRSSESNSDQAAVSSFR